jgi:hypothetical protein
MLLLKEPIPEGTIPVAPVPGWCSRHGNIFWWSSHGANLVHI